MFKKAIFTFLISMTPVLELRGSIPFGVAEGLPLWLAYIISVIGNMLPVPFIILFVRVIFKWLRTKSAWLERFVSKLEKKGEKNKEKVLKYEFWGLALLVLIPLPGTGAWTGALCASICDLQLKRAVPAIFIGVIIAGIIVSLATIGLIAII